MRAEIGVAFQTDKRPGEYAELARLAEAGGVGVVSVFADLLYQPPIGAVLEMAAATERVRLGVACWNPFVLHPYEIAGQVAAVDSASRGRAYLGLAPGSWLDVLGLTPRDPVGHVREAVTLIRALLRGDGTGVSGRYFPLAPGATLRYPLPDRVPPLLVGAWGPRMTALAGELADELKIGGSANADLVPVVHERLRPGCDRAGRSVDDVRLVFGAVTVVDTDAEAARERARHEVAMYLAVVAGLDPTVTVSTGTLDRLRAHVADGDHARAAALIDDDVLDRFAFSGDPAQVAAQAQRLVDAGVGRVEFGTPHGRTDASGVQLIVEQVLPRLRLDRPT